MNRETKIYLVIIAFMTLGIGAALLFNHFNPWVSIIFILLAFGLWILNFDKFSDWLLATPKKKSTKKRPTKK